EDAAPPGRVYWQFVLPQNERLLATPLDMTSEMVWSRDGWSFAERPVLDQRQLESWIKASRQELLPAASTDYLFGGLGRWPRLTVVLAPRWLTAVVSSSLALGLGLALIHIRMTRSPVFFLGLGVCFAGLAMVAPHMAWIAAQGAVLGVLTAACAAGLAWATA